MVGTFIMYLMTAVGGLQLWKIPLPIGGMTSAQILEPACYVANVGITLPTAILPSIILGRAMHRWG